MHGAGALVGGDDPRVRAHLAEWSRWARVRWGSGAVEPVTAIVREVLSAHPEATGAELTDALERAVMDSPACTDILLGKLTWRVREAWPGLGPMRARELVAELVAGIDLGEAVGDDEALGVLCRLVTARVRILRAEHEAAAVQSAGGDMALASGAPLTAAVAQAPSRRGDAAAPSAGGSGEASREPRDHYAPLRLSARAQQILAELQGPTAR